MSDCPAWHFFDTGDEAEAEHCSLPIEHNADDEPWHEATWQEDGMAATYRWRWDQETLICRRRSLTDDQRTIFSARLVSKFLPTLSWDATPPTTPKPWPTTINFPKWGKLGG